MGVRVREAQAVRAQVPLHPGQKVTKKLLAQYGDQLVGVRYRRNGRGGGGIRLDESGNRDVTRR